MLSHSLETLSLDFITTDMHIEQSLDNEDFASYMISFLQNFPSVKRMNFYNTVFLPPPFLVSVPLTHNSSHSYLKEAKVKLLNNPHPCHGKMDCGSVLEPNQPCPWGQSLVENPQVWAPPWNPFVLPRMPSGAEFPCGESLPSGEFILQLSASSVCLADCEMSSPNRYCVIGTFSEHKCSGVPVIHFMLDDTASCQIVVLIGSH